MNVVSFAGISYNNRSRGDTLGFSWISLMAETTNNEKQDNAVSMNKFTFSFYAADFDTKISRLKDEQYHLFSYVRIIDDSPFRLSTFA